MKSWRSCVLGLPAPVAWQEFKRQYDGVEIILTKRMSNNWMGSVSYTWSRLYGNYDGLTDSSNQELNDNPNQGRYCTYIEGC